jgi:hypothetical protein
MGKFLQYADKMSKITVEEQYDSILLILQNNALYAADLLTGQLLEGLDGDDQPLMHYHSEAYAEMKLHLNPRGVTDLKLEGNFHDSIFLKADQWPSIFDATDEKKNHLVSIYGKAILQLNDESLQLLIDHIKQDIFTYYRNLYKLR